MADVNPDQATADDTAPILPGFGSGPSYQGPNGSTVTTGPGAPSITGGTAGASNNGSFSLQPASAAPQPTIPNSAAQGIAEFLGSETAQGQAVGFNPNLSANDLILNYNSASTVVYGRSQIDISGAVSSMQLTRTIDGASTLVIVLEDPDRVWLNHPALNITAPITPIPPGTDPLSTVSPVTGSVSPTAGSVISPAAGSSGFNPQPGSLGSLAAGGPATATGGTGSGSSTGSTTGSTGSGQSDDSSLATNAGLIQGTPYRPTTVSITDGTNSLTFALVEHEKQGDELTLTFEDVLVNELRYCFPLSQGSTGLQSSSSGTSNSPAVGTTASVPAGGEQVGASDYGTPGSSASGAGGALTPSTYAFAELSTNPGASNLDFAALGHLPMGTLLEITYNGQTVIAEKLDVGAGGGPVDGKPRAIDLWWVTAQALGFDGLGLVTISPAPAGATPGPVTSSTAATTSTSPATTSPVTANTGAASGQTRADFMAMVVNQALTSLQGASLPLSTGGSVSSEVVQPLLAYPPDGTVGVEALSEQLTWGGSTATSSTGSSSSSPGVTEDAWSALVRLANEAQWRVFSDGTALWFGPDSWLLSGPVAGNFIERASVGQQPKTAPTSVWDPITSTGTFSGSTLAVADDIDFTWDIGQAEANLTVNTVAPLVTFPPGRIVAIWNCGLASGSNAGGLGTGPGLGAGVPSGPLWIVSQTSRAELTQPDVEIACVMAQPSIAETALAAQTADASTASGTGAQTTAAIVYPGGSAIAQQAVAIVQTTVGDKYVFGAAGPNQFDCSGLTSWAYGKAGLTIPRTSQAQYAAFPTVPCDTAHLVPGDLLYAEFGAGGPDHVGMYIGGGQTIQAPHTGAVVFITSLATSGFTAANRPTSGGSGTAAV